MSAGLTGRFRKYRFDWKLSLLTAVLMPLLLSLGVWQLRRGASADALQAAYEARQQVAAVPLALLDPAGDLQYRQVKFRGHYDNAHVFLLDNRLYQGQAGYEVIVPLITDDDRIVMVNRGWIAQGPSRLSLPMIAPVEGDVAVQGSVYQAVGKQVVLGADLEAAGWPKVVQTLEPVRMAELAGAQDRSRVFPHSIRIAENAPGALVRYWPVLSMSSERHRGYAVQWFMMALALATLYIFYSTKTDTLPDDER